MRRRSAFTLIELMVVVAIIAALLAILTPSLGRAREMAKLTKCGSNLKQIATGVITYAVQSRGAFPNRSAFGKPTSIKSGGVDHRPVVEDFVEVNLLQCPLSPEELDFDQDPCPAQEIEVNYGFWWDWKYNDGGGYVEQRMAGIASGAFTYQSQRFSVLAGDWESVGLANEISECSHNDRNRSMPAWTLDNGNYGGTIFKFSRWNQWTAGAGRGPVDKNFAFLDSSVRLFRNLDLRHTGGAFANVPAFRAAGTWSTYLPLAQ